MASTTITGLPSNTNPETSDYLVTDNGTTTSKVTIANMKMAMNVMRSINRLDDANDETIWGRFWANGSECANLPSSSDTAYFQVLCFGFVQFAIAHTANGPSKIWVRDYINSQWSPWTSVALA